MGETQCILHVLQNEGRPPFPVFQLRGASKAKKPIILRVDMTWKSCSAATFVAV